MFSNELETKWLAAIRFVVDHLSLQVIHANACLQIQPKFHLNESKVRNEDQRYPIRDIEDANYQDENL